MIPADILTKQSQIMLAPQAHIQRAITDYFQLYNDLFYVAQNDDDISEQAMQKIFFRHLLSTLLLQQEFVDIDETREAVLFYLPQMPFDENLYQEAWREVQRECIITVD